METVEATLKMFQQLPDWDKYPLPQVVYEKFNLPKPKPSVSLMESLAYTPPPHQSLNRDGKVEIRKPAEGGVREIPILPPIPVEQTLLKDESGDDSQKDSEQTTSNPPTANTTTETQPVSGLSCPGLSDAFPYISRAVGSHGVVYNLASPPPQSESSSSDPPPSET